jgi:hypothetical protein
MAAILSGGGAVALEVVYQASTTATNYGGTITMPTLAIGDIIIVSQAAVGSSNPSTAYGTDFTGIKVDNGSFTPAKATRHYKICESYKVAVSGDSGAGITGFMNDNGEAATVIVYRPTVSGVTVTPVGATTTKSTGNPASDTISVSSSAEITIAVSSAKVFDESSVSTPTMTFTPTEDISVSRIDNGTAACGVLTKALVQTPTATDVTADQGDDEYQNVHTSYYLEITV